MIILKKNLFKEMNDFLIGKKKLRYNFESIDEINIDPKTGRAYEAGFGEFEKLKPGTKLKEDAEEMFHISTEWVE